MAKTRKNKAFRVAAMLGMQWNFKRHTDIFAGVARYAAQHVDLHFVADDFADRRLNDHRHAASPYDAVLGRVTPGLAAAAQERDLPLVNVWIKSSAENVVSVLPDMAEAGRNLAEHLVSRGIRNLLCLVRRGDRAEKMLGQHFAETASRADCACDTFRVSRGFSHSHDQWEKTRGQIEQWLRHAAMPVGIVAGVDIMARHVVQLCLGLGLRVPQDVAVAGGHNEPTLCLYPEPSLTSIEYGYDRVGYEAAQKLHQILLGERVEPDVVLISPRELVVRQSSDFVYVDEPVVSAAMQFIAERAWDSISVDDVAIAAGALRRTVEQRFQHWLHRSVGAEIRRVRIEHAKRLLASSQQTISQIAPAVGFGTSQYMARVFRRDVGLSPRAYRNQSRLAD